LSVKSKRMGIWALVAALSVGAFYAGVGIRQIGTPRAPKKPMLQASVLLKLTPESAPVTLEASKQSGNEDRDLVSMALSRLKEAYFEPITKEKETLMSRGAVRGMIESLDDPDSRFLDPTERKLLDDAGAGRFHGIGAVCGLRQEKVGDLNETKVLIVAPMPGSPAEQAGLRAGDSVTYVDDKWVVTHDPFKEAGLEKMANQVRNHELDALTYQKTYEAALKRLKDGMGIPDALDSITSKSSGEISIRVQRPGVEKPIDVKVRCRKTLVEPVISRPVKHAIAYIRVTQFNRYTPAQFSGAWNRALAYQAKGLVLDLRNNPGGLMDIAADIAGRLGGGGLIANLEGADKARRAVYEPRTRKLSIPVVVLVNEGTASVAELVAGTLRERGATLVGERTFGDGLVQTPLLLKDGSAAVVTTGKMLTAKGVDFNGKGLVPDKQIHQGGPQTDVQLDEAMSILQAKIGKA